MLCNKQMQQPNATNKATLYYRLLPLALTRASYSQTCSDIKRCGTPTQRNRNAQYSSPDIKEKSFGIRHCLT